MNSSLDSPDGTSNDDCDFGVAHVVLKPQQQNVALRRREPREQVVDVAARELTPNMTALAAMLTVSADTLIAMSAGRRSSARAE